MRFFQNLRISIRLTFAFSIVIAFAIAAVATALVTARENADAVNRMMALPLAKERITADWYVHVYSAVGRTSLIAKSTDASLTAAFADEIALDAKKGTELGKQIKDLVSSNDEQNIYAAAMELRGKYLDAKAKIMAARQAGDTSTADAIFQNQFKTASQLYLKKVLELKKVERDAIDDTAKAINKATERSFRLVLFIIFLLVALGVTAAAAISRGITGPLTQAVAVARTVASGDLTTTFEPASADEVGDLLRSLKAMNVGLSYVIGKVQAGTNTIAVASSQIAMGNLDLSARTESQAGTLEQTAASMEELTATVRQNADNARNANRLASDASEIAVKGGVIVDQVVDAMDKIGSAAKKIVNIIGVIDGIAFQTNILALNAAVEAARAGEHGRGFAVVASEVRTLAQRAAAAAKEIKQLIGQSSEQVNQGEYLVEQAGQAMNAVVISIGKVTSIMSEITTASREQSAGIEQVNQAVSSMDHATQQNAALVEEAAAAAASLQEQAAGLATLAAGFVLAADASTLSSKKSTTPHSLERLRGLGLPVPVLK